MSKHNENRFTEEDFEEENDYEELGFVSRPRKKQTRVPFRGEAREDEERYRK